MKRVDKAADLIRKQFVESSLELMTVTPGHCRQNNKCQMNAVHDAVTAGDTELAMCVCVGKDGHPFTHFVNTSGGAYVDNTLGVWCREYKYYLVKVIYKKEFFIINKIFNSLVEDHSKRIPWYLKLLGAAYH